MSPVEGREGEEGQGALDWERPRALPFRVPNGSGAFDRGEPGFSHRGEKLLARRIAL